MVHTPGQRQRAGWAGVSLRVRACACVEGWANGSHGGGPPRPVQPRWLQAKPRRVSPVDQPGGDN